jgi:formylglycine-generating enzyme required for sulfatase activity
MKLAHALGALGILAVACATALGNARAEDPGVGETFRDCADCPEMVVVPAGEFMMGSPDSEARRKDVEGPVHRVSVRQPFAVGKYVVTKGQYADFANATWRRKLDGCDYWGGNGYKEFITRSWRSPGYAQTDEDPVVCVSYEDAKAYTAWLSLKTGHAYRLPSEAEWEYAARAGTVTKFHFGKMIFTDQANYNGMYTFDNGRRGVSLGKTVPVGSYPPNSFGLHDVHGNVFEWVEDCWHRDYEGAPADTKAWTATDCSLHVLRGGSFGNILWNVRSASRAMSGLEARNSNNGFRVARSLP